MTSQQIQPEGDESLFAATDGLYRQLFDANSDALFVHDASGRIMLVNRRMCDMFGYDRQETVQLTVGDLSSNQSPYTQADALQRLQDARNEGSAIFDWHCRRADGTEFWSEVALQSFRHAGEEYVLACVRNISHRKTFEDLLSEREERFSQIFDNASSMFALTEPSQGLIVAVNNAWCAKAGLSREAVLGKTGADLNLWTKPQDRDAVLDAMKRAGRVMDHEAVLNLGGQRLHCHVSAEFIEIGRKRHILWEVRDLSAQKQAEEERERIREQFLQAQKMESIGRLAGGVAHDFNNMLTVILGNIELAEQQVGSRAQARQYLDSARGAAERSANLTRQLLGFARKQTVVPRKLDLNEAISGMIRMLQRLIGENIKLKWVPAPDIWAIKIDPSQLDQVLANLCVNSRDAISDSGTISIATENRIFEKGLGEERPSGQFVRLLVSDSGMGMSKEVQARLFEPFFTTKQLGEGTGLGLATVYGIVKQNGGHITVYSEVGKGTTVTIDFPRCIEGPVSDAGMIPNSDIGGGYETVLLVEDEPAVLELVRRQIEALGYTVLATTSSREAIRLAREFRGTIHLLISDIIMPEMNGPQVSNEIRSFRKDIKTLFISGYAANLVAEQRLLTGDTFFLQKPFSFRDMAVTIRKSIGTPV